jgi:CBS domain-containing protein
MHVRDLMSQPVVTCHVNDPMNYAARLMWEHDSGVLPVVNDAGTLTGILTDRDVCMAAYTQGRSLDAILVNSAMARQPIAVHAEATLGDVEQLMAKHQIRRVPVIDEADRPIGIVSLNDLVREGARSRDPLKLGLQKVAHTLAAICQPHANDRKAAGAAASDLQLERTARGQRARLADAPR